MRLQFWHRRPLCRIGGAHRRTNHLSPVIVGNTEYSNIGYRGVSEQNGFDFTRIDIFSTADNHVAQATRDLDVSAIIHCPEIACAHPAIRTNRVSRCFRHVEIADHALVATRLNLSFETGG